MPDLYDDLIHPLPSQRKALELMWKYEYLLFGGQAGPGKSYWLRWAAIELLYTWFTRLGLRMVTVGMFCEDYPTLKDRQIAKIKREFPLWLGEIKETKEEGLHFALRDKYGAGRISLRNLDEPSKYASAEFAAILVDELTKNDKQTFDDLRFRKRWPGIEHSPFLAASNPGSKGHAWVKKLWVDRNFTGEDERIKSDRFYYLPAKGKENPHLPQSYWDTLDSLPGPMRKAMLEGDWDVFAGQYFDSWRRDVHVVEPVALPRNWRRIIAIDYGYEAPSAVLWMAVDNDGGCWVYRELYIRKKTYLELVSIILEMTPLEEPVYAAVADPAIWGDRPHHGEQIGRSGGELMAHKLQQRWIPLYKANNDRIQGWQVLRQLMKVRETPEQGPVSRLHIFSTCLNLIRTLPAQVHDTIHVEDVDTDGEDHAPDALRYGVNTKFAEIQTMKRRRVLERSRPSTTAMVG